MTEKPEDRSGERRRTGPLGESDDETTRQPPAEEAARGDEATRQIPAQQPPGRTEARDETEEGDGRRSSRNLRRASRAGGESDRSESEDKETRVIRTPGAGDTREAAYPRGYFEAAEEREERLRDIYGGVDWLASFLGFVFAAVAGGIFAAIAALVLVPLGFSLEIGSGGVMEITTLVVLAVLIFFTYFFGGYVAGRLARFDGGRNGAMSVVWGIVVGALLLALGGILPGALFQTVRDFLTETIAPAVMGLLGSGIIGLAVIVGAIVVALLGGLAGGRLGSRYHAEIDRTT